MKLPKITLIAAVAENNVIGKDGHLLWHLPQDLKWFEQKTTGKTVVMGRRSYEDIIRYTKNKPLRNRTNIVITSQTSLPEGFVLAHSIEQAISLTTTDELMVIGGNKVYAEFLPLADEIILTEVHEAFEGDTVFPSWDKSLFQETYRQPNTENDISYDFVVYSKI